MHVTSTQLDDHKCEAAPTFYRVLATQGCSSANLAATAARSAYAAAGWARAVQIGANSLRIQLGRHVLTADRNDIAVTGWSGA